MESSTVETAASILVNNIINVLNNKESTAQRLGEALRPFSVIQWGREVLDHVAIPRMNRLLGRLKRSPAPKATLRLVTDHLHRAINSEGTIVPMRFTEWSNAVMRTSLNNLANHDTWLSVWESLESHRIPDPPTLAKVSLIEIQSLAESPHYDEPMQALWQAIRIEAAQNSGIAQPIVTFRQNIASLPEALRAPNAELAAIGVDFQESKLDIGLPSNFDTLGPMARISALQEADPDSQRLLRFLSVGAHQNILQQVRLTLPQVASGVSCYLSFCSLLGIAPFPPTSTVVQQWSTLFTGKNLSTLHQSSTQSVSASTTRYVLER